MRNNTNNIIMTVVRLDVPMLPTVKNENKIQQFNSLWSRIINVNLDIRKKSVEQDKCRKYPKYLT